MKQSWAHMDQFRKLTPPFASTPGDRWGAFFYPIGRDSLTIMATAGPEPGHAYDWEHVSVHARHNNEPRLSTWNEMCRVKNLFWDEEETVMQLHPAKANYVNDHPCVLHLWKPIAVQIPLPPSILVGIGRK